MLLTAATRIHFGAPFAGAFVSRTVSNWVDLLIVDEGLQWSHFRS